jgi:hypothetical protein
MTRKILDICDNDYNQFATSLVRLVADRAKGRDEESNRITDVRPEEHILTGFLTPVKTRQHQIVTAEGSTADNEQAEIISDLPQDEAYEQTTIGLEWACERATVKPGQSITLTVTFYVYVRRLPTRTEQQNMAWKKAPEKNALFSKVGALAERRADIRPVWTRESIGPLSIRIESIDILRNKRYQVSLKQEVKKAWDSIDKNGLYPGQRRLQVQESHLQSNQAWQAWADSQQGNQRPVEWDPRLDLRVIESRSEPNVIRLALRLINQTTTLSSDYLDPNFYGVWLEARFPIEAWKPTIFRELPESFRYEREMPAIGINAHAEAHIQDGELILCIDSVPVKRIYRLEPRSIAGAEPAFIKLAVNPFPLLRAILSDMERYDHEEWERKILSLNGRELQDAQDARKDFRQEIERFACGIEVLANDKYPAIRRAFSLMNQTMHEYQQMAGNRYQQWRLFQIVFIVSQLPELAAREYPELAIEAPETVDILWFAAGGGKTEAFLGLTIWQAFFDRLRGKKFGVTSFVRFPLRLLAFQQLQRLGRAMAAAEVVRQREKIKGARFSIGYFVGGTLTPNRIDDRDHRRFQSQVDPHLQLFHSCPFCGNLVRLDYDAGLRLVMHLCTSLHCPGGTKRLPVYVIDLDIYRYLPTVIVSTVDKLAQLGQNQRFANLLGRFDMMCHQHGASFQDNNGKDNFCAAAKQYGALKKQGASTLAQKERPRTCGQSQHRVEYDFHDPAPALLIQDEMHLLSEELGTFDAHYETAALEMMQGFGSGKPWKIIAATATIREYHEHAWHLYLQHARQFPGPGPFAYDSFYYSQDPSRIGRIFVGILGVGRKHTAAVTRLLSLIYLELEKARNLSSDDPVQAASRYGLSSLNREQFLKLVFQYELALTYVLTRKGSDQVAEAIDTRVRKDLEELAPKHGELIIDTFNGSADPAQMKQSLEQISIADESGSPSERIRGVVTTNIIGHGVDVDRFNIIVFAGFTRHVAEYIQASARVGRRYPGISFLVATPQSERDRSIFDRFAKFHEYLDRLVDASAINRWPEAALRQTLPGILSGYLMGVAACSLGKPLATVRDVQDYYGRLGAEALNEESIQEWIMKAYRSEYASDRFRTELHNLTRRTYNLIDKIRRQEGRSEGINIQLKAMRSLRDVDEPAEIWLASELDDEILRRLIHG